MAGVKTIGAPQIIRSPSGEELVVLPRATMRRSSNAPIMRPRMPMTSLSMILGRQNCQPVTAYCRRRLVLQFFEATAG